MTEENNQLSDLTKEEMKHVQGGQLPQKISATAVKHLKNNLSPNVLSKIHDAVSRA